MGDNKSLIELPKCPTHGTTMSYKKAETPEQDFCGAWYECLEPGCHCSAVIMSKELLKLYRPNRQNKAPSTFSQRGERSDYEKNH